MLSQKIRRWHLRVVFCSTGKFLSKVITDPKVITKTTSEINEQKLQLIHLAQQLGEKSDHFASQRESLNLQKNSDGLYKYECRDFLHCLSQENHCLWRRSHIMGIFKQFIVRQHYWRPKLRALLKKIRKDCYNCKQFRETVLAKPPPGNLPSDRTIGLRAFQVAGVDYAGPQYTVTFLRVKAKAYILLFPCSLTREIHLQALPDQSNDQFIRSLQLFIARRGDPEKCNQTTQRYLKQLLFRWRKL